MCWHAAIVLAIIPKPPNKETYGFNSLKPPPRVPQLDGFKDKLHDLVQKLEFRKSTNNLQKKMKKELKKIKRENKLIIKADKSNKFYKMDVRDYSETIRRDITKEYKKTQEKKVKDVTKQDKQIAQKLKLDDRIFQNI